MDISVARCCFNPFQTYWSTALFANYSQQPRSWVSISGPGPGATFHGRENPEHLAVEPVEPVEPVALEPLRFLNPRNFWNLWNQLNAWGSTGSKHSLGSTRPLVPQVPDRFLGFNHAMVPQLPDRFLGFKKRAVPQVPCIPWVQQRTGSTGFQTGSLGSNTQWFHRFHTGSLGSARPLVPQVPDRFLGFNRGTVGIVEGVNFGNYPNYVAPNAPLCRTIFGMGGDVFLTGMLFTNRNHATGSTASRQVPWVQPRHWFHSFQTGSLGSNTPWVQQVPCRFLGFNHATGSTGFQTGSSGSTVELWELWRVWISVTILSKLHFA